jgi:hypothetical protein
MTWFSRIFIYFLFDCLNKYLVRLPNQVPKPCLQYFIPVPHRRIYFDIEHYILSQYKETE